MKHDRGFTLVELILVMVLTGILASTLTVFLKPTVDAYVDSKRRSDVSDMADGALRQVMQDIRRAVPNSLIRHSATCLQLTPSVAGGAYREPASPTVSSIEALTLQGRSPANGDWLWIDGASARISGLAAGTADYLNAITLQSPFAINVASASLGATTAGMGRFFVIDHAEQSVFLQCTGNRLYRKTVASQAGNPAYCTSTDGALLAAADVLNCNFSDAGSIGPRAYLWLELTMTNAGESVTLVHGTHVDNVP